MTTQLAAIIGLEVSDYECQKVYNAFSGGITTNWFHRYGDKKRHQHK